VLGHKLLFQQKLDITWLHKLNHYLNILVDFLYRLVNKKTFCIKHLKVLGILKFIGLLAQYHSFISKINIRSKEIFRDLWISFDIYNLRESVDIIPNFGGFFQTKDDNILEFLKVFGPQRKDKIVDGRVNSAKYDMVANLGGILYGNGGNMH
jgi:hypothetical protein